MFRTLLLGCFCGFFIGSVMNSVWAQSAMKTDSVEQRNTFGMESVPFGTANKQALNNPLQTITIVNDSVVPKDFQMDKEAYKFGKRMAEKNKTILFGNNFATSSSVEMIKGAIQAKGQVVIVTDEKTYQKNCSMQSVCRQAVFIPITSPEQQRRYIQHKTDLYVILPAGWETVGVFSNLMQQTAESTGLYMPFETQTQNTGTKSSVKDDRFKPIIFFNINHFWDNMRYFTEEMNRQGVLSKQQMKYIYFVDKPKDILKTADKMLKEMSQN